MSAEVPDAVAFQVFQWNKRRFAIPINAKGEQLGPAVPFRNLNRNKRHGYGPGSSNTSLVEADVSVPQSPLNAADATATPLPTGSKDVSFSSGSSSSATPSRSGRPRLSRSVSFLQRATAGATYTKLIDYPKEREQVPPSILQRTSSFRVTLRPLFDFEYEPPHTPREVALPKVKEKREKATEATMTWAGKLTTPPQVSKSAPVPSRSPPLMTNAQELERPHTPPAPQRKTGSGIPSARRHTISAVEVVARVPSHVSQRSSTKATMKDTKPAPFPGQTAETKADERTAAESVALTPLRKTAPKASSLFPKDAVTPVRTTVPLPSHDDEDLLYLLKLSDLSSSAQAGKMTSAKNTTSRPDVATTAATTTLSTTHIEKRKQRHRQHRDRHHNEKHKPVTQRSEAVLAASPEAKPRAQKEKLSHLSAKESVDHEKKKGMSTSAARLNVSEVATSTQMSEPRGGESPAPKFSGFLTPPPTHAVAARELSGPLFPTPPSKHVDRRAYSPVVDDAPELGKSQLNGVLHLCDDTAVEEEDVNVNPSAPLEDDIYELFRYCVPQSVTPTRSTVAFAHASPLTALGVNKAERVNTTAASSVPAQNVAVDADMDIYHYPGLETLSQTPPLLQPPQATPPSVSSSSLSPHNKNVVISDLDEAASVASRSSLFLSSVSPHTSSTATNTHAGAFTGRPPLPPLHARPLGSLQTRRHTVPQPALTQPLSLPPPTAVSPQSVFSVGSSHRLCMSKSFSSSTSEDNTTAPSSMSSSCDTRYTAECDEERKDDGYDEATPHGSAATFSTATSGDVSAESYAAASATSAADSKTTTTSSTSSSGDLLNTNHGSIWSSMMRRLRKPLFMKPPTEEDVSMQQRNGYRHRRALERSRVYYGRRVEAVRSGKAGLSSAKTEGAVDSLQHHRQAKKDPSPESRWSRKRFF